MSGASSNAVTMMESMYIDLDAFYGIELLKQAKDRLIKHYITQITQAGPDPEDPEMDLIQFQDATLSLLIEEGVIDVELDTIPSFLKNNYMQSNIIEYNKHAYLLGMLDLNKPPKSLAAKTELSRCELYIIAQIIENAILITFHLNKFAEFQFYTPAGYLGILTRVRLNRDIVSGLYYNYDCLIFAGKYKVEKRDIEVLEDISTIVESDDYCFEDLPVLLDELKDLTLKPYVAAEVIAGIEKLHRIKVPKVPLFYRIPFLAWDQRDRTSFHVQGENISLISY
jgi:hypothetical protein